MRILLLLIALFFTNQALALPEYGRKCDENPDCVLCRDTQNWCSMCMNSCYNKYGPAEVDITKRSRDKDELCRLRMAKWCNAQCWDPDDKLVPDYVSSKPLCSDKPYPSYKKREDIPW